MHYYPKIIPLSFEPIITRIHTLKSKTAKDTVNEYFTYKSLFHGAQTNQTMS